MSTRLQVVMDEAELEEIQAVADGARLTVSAWVRQVLRDARGSAGAAPGASPERHELWSAPPDSRAAYTRPEDSPWLVRESTSGYGREDAVSATVEPWADAFTARDFTRGDVGALIVGAQPVGEALEIEWYWLWLEGLVQSGRAVVDLPSLGPLSAVSGRTLDRRSVSRLIQERVRRVLELAPQAEPQDSDFPARPQFGPIPIFELLVLRLEPRGEALFQALEASDIEPLQALGRALGGVSVEVS